VGSLNPGFGYWWVQTTNGFALWHPPPSHTDVFWPLFVLITGVWIVFGGLYLRLSPRGLTPPGRGAK
jgi:hypothetical protein